MIAKRFALHDRVLGRLVLVTALGVSLVFTARFAGGEAQAYEITAAQRAACTPDVMRLCSSQLPDADRVVACMRSNHASVSTACRSAFPAWTGSGRAKVATR